MRQGGLFHENSDLCLLPRVWRAVSAFERMRGLLGRPPLLEGEGLLIEQCAMVHTFGMAYRLDLVFFDSCYRIRKLVADLAPMRFAACPGAAMTLELFAGSLAILDLKPGDQLYWRETT